MPTIYCPVCKQSYDVESNIIGQKVCCAVCNQTFIAKEGEPIRLQLKTTSSGKSLNTNMNSDSHKSGNSSSIGKSISGEENPTVKQQLLNGLISGIIVCVLAVLAAGSCDYIGGSSGSSHVETNKQYHMTAGAVGFTSKDSLEKYHQYYQQNDNSARMSFLNSHMATGDAVMFYGGETVTVSDMSPLSGMAKIRKPGSYSEYWTYSVWLE